MHKMTSEMRRCIDACVSCYETCTSMAMGHCLEKGGAHVEQKHFTLMIACAEICRTAAQFMLIGSEHHRHICRSCAQICDECATDCERLGDMQNCVDACRSCAEECRKMAA
jgi:hypothetical protein